MRRLKIVSVANHCCFRVHKENLPLLRQGHDIHLISGKPVGYMERYKSVLWFQQEEQLYDSIALHKDADIFHVHNEPSWFVNAVKAVYPDTPVVLDVHDSFLIRYPEDTDGTNAKVNRFTVDERNNFQLADGLIFVSKPMADICRKTFDLQQPYGVLPSYMPKEFYRLDAFRLMGGVVYEGRVDIKEELTEHNEFFAYCDYRDMARELHALGIPLYMMAPNRKIDEMNKAYEGNALFVKTHIPGNLTRVLGSHNYGILGNLTPHEAWKYAMPNKLFDYLAAGLPVIALNAPLAGKFVEDYGFGMNITDVNDIPKRWAEHRTFRKTIAEHRFDWCMEKHMHRIEDVYRKVLNGR